MSPPNGRRISIHLRLSITASQNQKIAHYIHPIIVPQQFVSLAKNHAGAINEVQVIVCNGGWSNYSLPKSPPSLVSAVIPYSLFMPIFPLTNHYPSSQA
jgi:hypothetical protein